MKRFLLVFLSLSVAASVSAVDLNFRVRKHLERAPETFLWVSDVQFSPCHPENLSGEKAVVSAVMRHNPSFVLNGGDFVEDKPAHDAVCIASGWDNPSISGPWDFQLFESTWSPVVDSLGKNNLYGVAGNHDFWADATWAYAHKDSYLVRDGIFFLMLNVSGPTDSSIPTWDNDWAEKMLSSEEAQNAQFRIVIFHEPGTTNRSGGWNNSQMAQTIREKLYPLFSEYRVDAILNGHIHTYRRWMENGIIHVISGGGGGGFQGDAGDVVNSSNYHNFIEFHKEFDGVTGDWRLSASVVGIDMTNPNEPEEYQIDSFEINSQSK